MSQKGQYSKVGMAQKGIVPKWTCLKKGTLAKCACLKKVDSQSGHLAKNKFPKVKIWQKVCVSKRSYHQMHLYQIEQILRLLSHKELYQTAHSQNGLQPTMWSIGLLRTSSISWEHPFLCCHWQILHKVHFKKILGKIWRFKTNSCSQHTIDRQFDWGWMPLLGHILITQRFLGHLCVRKRDFWTNSHHGFDDFFLIFYKEAIFRSIWRFDRNYGNIFLVSIWGILVNSWRTSFHVKRFDRNCVTIFPR